MAGTAILLDESMHLLYCDESNLDEHQGDFLIYGGVLVSSEAAASLSGEMERIRTAAGIPRDFRFKFNPRPDGMDHVAYREVKQAVIEQAVAHDVGLLSYAILHDISANPDEARRFGINTVCYHFDCCLQRLDSKGLVLLDRFNDDGNLIDGHLTEKFSIGLTNMPYAEEYRLKNILGFHYTTIGQSHFTSLIDIVVGSLRYAMNVHTRSNNGQRQSAINLLQLLSPLFVRHAGSDQVSEFGLLFSPKVVKSQRYREQYQSMKDFFAEAGVIIAQEITGERNY
jgi:hypothetical protein